ncbi:anthranilate synthase component I [Hyphococcus flavus]|uniref:Anthranilate synthase component 1 n=1 Tax=Hyphococcus flavus TaxID=1866326 RepID=A0AAF0CBJ2_9PROT|nr:anthranilate synthase component I [Hyphococcus flavus]WDI31090.1 anthranilate synthase component I [Hyphococcus flavus]
MTALPDFKHFEAAYQSGKPQLLQRTLVGDLETPVSAYLKLVTKTDNAFLLESVEGGEQLGRYSIIGLEPDVIWKCCGEYSEINRNALSDGAHFERQDGAPLDNLKALLAESALAPPENAPPMAAGVFGYLGYDMIRQVESLGDKPAGGLDTPDSIFIRPTIIAVFDNVKQEILLYSPVRPETGVSAISAYETASKRLENCVARFESSLSHLNTEPAEAARNTNHQSNTKQSDYVNMVKRAKDYIRAGDIFQVVLSQRFSRPFSAPPFELYRALRRSNPSPFMYYFSLGGFAIVGSSPEILVRVRDGEITIRPIAGTRPRGKTPKDDLRLEKELLNDPKERAEHLMLLDLGRNDVGRSAEIGSVRVTDQFKIERYSHVMHIVSNVVGTLRNDEHPVNAVVNGFPAGTVSGAPKIRAMEIIDELEQSPRGVYAGAIGYFSANGNVDTCIALRTAIVKDGVMHVQAGAGIVADSDPAAEQNECENKAKALFAAADAALNRNHS